MILARRRIHDALKRAKISVERFKSDPADHHLKRARANLRVALSESETAWTMETDQLFREALSAYLEATSKNVYYPPA